MGLRGFRQIRDRLVGKRLSQKLADESGQSIILISVVIVSFLMFFSFAINTGLLINAKISVQAAADAAAYAGAAVQARQLNAISFLNYDMREQYKKFIFRYTFVSSMGSYKFPQVTISKSKTYDFEKKDYSAPGNVLALNVPVVCIPLTAGLSPNDNCLVINLVNTANTAKGSNSTGNIIQDALIQSLTDIANTQNNLCQGQGAMNFYVLSAWLFRGDIDIAQLTQMITTLGTKTPGVSPTSTQDMVTTITPLVSGLGLYPKNIINGMRAHTLESYLNQQHETGITADSVLSWIAATDSDARERTIQAFQSAAANLNTTVFDSTQTSMDELQADQMITLGDVNINFNAYVQHMAPNTNPTTPDDKFTCTSSVDPFPVIAAPVGVNVISMNVNYGVKVHAFIKPHGLLFLPNSDALELDAYAGAKPFGARIGPAVTPKFVTSIQPPLVNGAVVNDCQGTAKCDVPILDIGAGDTSYSTDYLADLKTMATGGGNTYSLPGILLAQTSALGPTPEEVGHYNIIPPPKPVANSMSEFIPYAADATAYRFYAPVFPAGKSDVSGQVSAVLTKIFAKTQIGNDANPFNVNTNDMKNLIQTTIVNYITNALPKGGASTELGETTTFAAINFPMPTTLKAGPKGYWLTQSNQVLSSWGPGPGNKFIPRFGYSVKFATLHDLQSEGMPGDDPDLATIAH